MPDSEVDVLYGIGGAPEAGRGIRSGDPRAGRRYAGRLPARHDVKASTAKKNRRIEQELAARCKAMGIEAGKALCLGRHGA